MVDEESEILNDLDAIMKKLKEIKGEERTPRARAIAVTVTMVERALAYFSYYVLDGNAE
jgi:hypothetical protein